MRWLLGILLTLSLLVLGGYVFIKGYPYKLYSGWVQGKSWNKYYHIDNYRSSYLRPVTLEEIPPYKEDYQQLWKDFPLRNIRIPLPVRHPLFQTVPIIEASKNVDATQLGIVFLSSNERELSRVYTFPTTLYQDHSQGQDLFKLPFVKNRILKYPLDKLWADIFTYEIEVKSKSLDDMIYDLYILHLRSKILPKDTVRFGLIKEGKAALIELSSRDQDYIVELILTFENGTIYSYALKTEKNNQDSRKLRSKFLESISFGPVDPAMGRILYTEFKHLNFARQVDQEGMLYLFTAWSQDLKNVELLREMIFYLERGRTNTAQLRPLYQYALKQYGKTFTTKKLFNDHDDPNLLLQRKIEIEGIEKKQAAERSKSKAPLESDLTPDEKMNLYLKKAKEEGPLPKQDMTIH